MFYNIFIVLFCKRLRRINDIDEGVASSAEPSAMHKIRSFCTLICTKM